ncbi:hypothetical protein DPMN_122373 [Dreissena polymorpha]|uniref:Uncharacterized protein n=1 Tax=Dreissena polymorpha TaxID=45954 RepID=A0A9D4JUF1_DREPO|nr:hypothetical protein DPMN_122373 [Dreissena polymorpha]
MFTVPQPMNVSITYIHHRCLRKVPHHILRNSIPYPRKLVWREGGVPKHPPPTNASHHNAGDTSCLHQPAQPEDSQTDVSGLTVMSFPPRQRITTSGPHCNMSSIRSIFGFNTLMPPWPKKR